MTLADLLPLMTETVSHWQPATYDIFGEALPGDFTQHPARVIYTPTRAYAQGSGDFIADAAATIWLVNHPNPIPIGSTFELPDGTVLQAIQIERRQLGPDTLSKVHLS